MKHSSAEAKWKATSIPAMQRHSLVFALALALPLALYGVPYAYASVASSDHVVRSLLTVAAGAESAVNVACPTGDYAVSGGYESGSISFSSSTGHRFFPDIFSTVPTLGGVPTNTGQTPDGWDFAGTNDDVGPDSAQVWVVCRLR
jgi:hypothetical protein